MRYLIYGPGTAREHATLGQLRHRLGARAVAFALEGRNALLESEPNVYRVRGARHAAELAVRLRADGVLMLSPQAASPGTVETFGRARIPTIGASARLAELEVRKSAGKRFMKRYRVPTPDSKLFRSLRAASAYVERTWDSDSRLVVKRDDFIDDAYRRTATPVVRDECLSELRRIGDGRFPILVEQNVTGHEISLHLAWSKGSYAVLPLVCDYKRLLEGDRGPLTHGMGAVCSSNGAAAILPAIHERIVTPTVEGLRAEFATESAILYIGVIMTPEGPMVLEYNARPGNPEWIAMLEVMGDALPTLVEDMLHAKLQQAYEGATRFGVAVSGVSYGYPTVPREEFSEELRGVGPSRRLANVWGECVVRGPDGTLRPSGGRVVVVSAGAARLAQARRRVGDSLDRLACRGLFYRKDIGAVDPIKKLRA